MMMRCLNRMWVTILLCGTATGVAFGQYPGGGTTGSSGGGYGGAGKAVGIGAGVAAGAGIAYLALHNRGTVTGCVESSSDGIKLMNEKDGNTYALRADNSIALKPGERVRLKGKRVRDDSRAFTFQVQRLAKNYGACKQ